jgi:4-cresol dehydrogenase (hydroxylating) flavoprotein subunit
MTPNKLEPAIIEFCEALGQEHVLTNAKALERYRWCTLPVQRNIAAVLRPASVEELQHVVRIANSHRVSLYPISTGNNWGYGSAQPIQQDNVVVDLSRMDRIVEVNKELAYAVIEPGVTQRQLYAHLQGQGLALWINPTGAGPDCSILGNTLERGFGIGPNGDHFLAQCGMEVVLATGEVLRTGFGHYPGAKAAYLYKWGLGPYLDGLFTQSNLGIVTKIGVWLMPEPEAFEACYFSCKSEAQLGLVIDGVRQLLSTGIFQGPINLIHRNRALIMMDRYPWAEMSGQRPLLESVATKLAAQKKIGVWNGVGAICGSQAQVRAARQTIRDVLGAKVDRITFLSDKNLQLLRRYPKSASLFLKMNVPELLKTLEASFGMLKGIPSEVALPLAYWRNKRVPPPAEKINPAQDNCGLMWFAPVVPMTVHDVATFRSIIEPVFAKYGFESCITLTAVNQRCFDCTLPLLYDKEDAGETQRAESCYAELLAACKSEGYVPYRLGIQSMAKETSGDDVFWTVVRRLKVALDPNEILAPGRYAS